MDKLTRSQRRALVNRTHAHYDTKRQLPIYQCPRCAASVSLARSAVGRFPVWYPSTPERTFLFCEPFTGPDLLRGCNLIWDARERTS
jgi:hypothetical protein